MPTSQPNSASEIHAFEDMISRAPKATALIAIVVVAALQPPQIQACSTFLVGKGASVDGSLFVSHSDDGEGDPDARLSFIPAADHAPGAFRDVWPDLEDNPRFVGTARGETYLPGRGVPSDAKWTEPIGKIPQVNHTYAYTEGNYGIMNEKQLSIGESTCSGKFVANAKGSGGTALFCVNELSRIAMERCVTARCAIRTMGDLATEHGFYGASGSFEGGSETLLIADTSEGWVMHFVPYPETNAAVWVAKRVPDDEVTVVMNMFTIRNVNLHDPDNYMYSENVIDVAIKHGLWDPSGKDGVFDFTKAYSDGEYAHKYYSGRRAWGAFRLVDPSVELDPNYGDLRMDDPYPWSMKPAKLVSASDLFAWHRDWYQDTPFDMSAGVAAGPWGSPDRFNGGDAEGTIPGSFERSIALHRTTYTHVLQTRGWLPDAIGGITWYGPHAAHGTCFVPVPAGIKKLPAALTIGNATRVDRDSQWWAHRYVHNLAQMKYAYAVEDIRTAQAKWEHEGAQLVAAVDAKLGGRAAVSPDELDVALGMFEAHLDNVRAAWWRLGDVIMANYADGFVSTRETGASVGYPAWWLEAAGWREGPEPIPPPKTKGAKILRQGGGALKRGSRTRKAGSASLASAFRG